MTQRDLKVETAPEQLRDKFSGLERVIDSCEACMFFIGNKVVKLEKYPILERSTGFDGVGESDTRFSSTVKISIRGNEGGDNTVNIAQRPTTFQDIQSPDGRLLKRRANGYITVDVGDKRVADAVEEAVSGWKVGTDIVGVEEIDQIITLLQAMHDEQQANKQEQADKMKEKQNQLKTAMNSILKMQ